MAAWLLPSSVIPAVMDPELPPTFLPLCVVLCSFCRRTLPFLVARPPLSTVIRAPMFLEGIPPQPRASPPCWSKGLILCILQWTSLKSLDKSPSMRVASPQWSTFGDLSAVFFPLSEPGSDVDHVLGDQTVCGPKCDNLKRAWQCWE